MLKCLFFQGTVIWTEAWHFPDRRPAWIQPLGPFLWEHKAERPLFKAGQPLKQELTFSNQDSPLLCSLRAVSIRKQCNGVYSNSRLLNVLKSMQLFLFSLKDRNWALLRDRTVPQLLFFCLSHIRLVLLSNLIHLQCLRVILIIGGRKHEVPACFWETPCRLRRIQANAQARSACCRFSGEEEEWVSRRGVQLLAGGESRESPSAIVTSRREEKSRGYLLGRMHSRGSGAHIPAWNPDLYPAATVRNPTLNKDGLPFLVTERGAV